MRIRDKYYNLASEIGIVTFSKKPTEEKKTCYEDFKSRIEKLDKKFSKKEKLLDRLKIFENELANDFACQEFADRMLRQLQTLIETEENGLS